MRLIRMAIGAVLALAALAVAGLGCYLAVALADGQDPDVVGNPVLFVAVFLASAAIPAALATRLITGVVVGKTKRRALIMIAAISASAITFMPYRFKGAAQMIVPSFIGAPIIVLSRPLTGLLPHVAPPGPEPEGFADEFMRALWAGWFLISLACAYLAQAGFRRSTGD